MSTVTEPPAAPAAPPAPAAPQPASAPATTPAPAPESSSPPPPSTETNGTAPAAETTAPSRLPVDELHRWLDDATPEELDRLAQHRRVTGKIGAQADRLAERRLAERQAQAEQDRLRQLRDADPYKFAEEARRMEQQHQEEVKRQSAVNNYHGELMSGIQAFQTETLSRERLEKIAYKQYPGSVPEGIKAYLKDVTDLAIEERLAKEREKWEKDATPALRKRILAELNGGEAPEVGSGSPPAGALTQAEFDRHRADKAWIKQNMPRINEALSQRRITH